MNEADMQIKPICVSLWRGPPPVPLQVETSPPPIERLETSALGRPARAPSSFIKFVVVAISQRRETRSSCSLARAHVVEFEQGAGPLVRLDGPTAASAPAR